MFVVCVVCMLIAYRSNPFSQDCKGRQFELCPSRILPGAGGLPRILPGACAEGQHPTVGRSKARMGVRLLGRAMLRLDGCGGHQLQFCGNGLDR